MTVLSTLLANATTFDRTPPIVGRDRLVYQWLKRRQALLDPALPTAYAARDQVSSIAIYAGTVSGGNFTISITFGALAVITTASIAHNAAAATIETAIDVAVTSAGTIVGWTNADISVSGGDLTANPVVLTFDGTSVDSDRAIVAITDVDLSGGGTVGAVSETTTGQPVRNQLAALAVTSVITEAPAAYRTAVASTYFTATAGPAGLENYPGASVVQALAREAGEHEPGAGYELAICTALNLPTKYDVSP